MFYTLDFIGKLALWELRVKHFRIRFYRTREEAMKTVTRYRQMLQSEQDRQERTDEIEHESFAEMPHSVILGGTMNCPHCHTDPCTCPHGWPESPEPLKISEADLRGVFGHQCDQPNCPVCHPGMSLTELAELYERAASPRNPR